jgi:hypothetical protein
VKPVALEEGPISASLNLMLFLKFFAMKRLIIVFCLCLAGIFLNGFSQGTLQFNQVLWFQLEDEVSFPISVPAGKVWKIESAAINAGSSQMFVYLRNSTDETVAILEKGTDDYTQPLPYWLPSGYTGSFYFWYSSTGPYRASVSIIEFNVIP